MIRSGHHTVPRAREVTIGPVTMGGNHPVVVQSMASTDTGDRVKSMKQYLDLSEAGAQLVRFTVQGTRELEALRTLVSDHPGITGKVPVVADIHFRPELANQAARFCGKVRINPGNFTERTAAWTRGDENAFHEGHERNRRQFLELIGHCRKHHTAVRIGVNHGSLSGRMMARYGNTPEGMAESAMEFIRIAQEEDFRNIVVSLKSSHAGIMVRAVRLLAGRMIDEGVYCPLHLGVTEAGNETEGILKSVAGIAPLLMEGFGDTIRVSLTGDPVTEIPVAKAICSLFPKPESLPYHPLQGLPWNPVSFNRPLSAEVDGVGGGKPPVILSASIPQNGEMQPDLVLTGEDDHRFLVLRVSDPIPRVPADANGRIILLDSTGTSMVDVKYWLSLYYASQSSSPVILSRTYDEPDRQLFQLVCGGELAGVLIDRLVDGIHIRHSGFPENEIVDLGFMILQAAGVRSTRTEYIACPSCGRTRFDIEKVLSEVKSATSHLRSLKIAVMGCIVNGPGEMADADYGYVGSGRDRVTLYRGKEKMIENVEARRAVGKLIELIRVHGDWVDPPESLE